MGGEKTKSSPGEKNEKNNLNTRRQKSNTLSWDKHIKSNRHQRWPKNEDVPEKSSRFIAEETISKKQIGEKKSNLCNAHWRGGYDLAGENGNSSASRLGGSTQGGGNRNEKPPRE